jgi:hypothetical protein
MIYIPILIIIIILGLDLYLNYSIKFLKPSNENMENNENNENNEEEKIFEKPNPWNKIQYFTHINKYYIQIDTLNEHIEKIMLWKSLPIIKTDLIDIDIDNNYLILKTHSEEEALVICNLIINHINNNLTINDIVSKNLINYSINKAKRFKLISSKLTELIKEGIHELNNNIDKLTQPDFIETQDDDDKDIIDKIKMKNVNLNEINNNNIISSNVNEITNPFDKITPYEGSEYASIYF